MLLIHLGLEIITSDDSIDMEWKRYESKIVNAHQVQLVGWPVKDFDPHVLGLKDLETCMAALSGPEPTCYWRRINDQELSEYQEDVAKKVASGEIVVKERKKWSDAGKKCRSYRRKRRVMDDSDKENEDVNGTVSKKQNSMRNDMDDESE
jgi:hypothetical protein